LKRGNKNLLYLIFRIYEVLHKYLNLNPEL